MTAMKAFDERLPSEIDIKSADNLREIIAGALDAGTDGAKIKFANQEGKLAEVVLTPSIAETFIKVLRLISNGQGFHVIPYKAELTTQEAADFLNVSRPFLIKLLEQHDIAYDRVGRHRRIKAEDLFEYKHKRDQSRARALEELAKEDASLGQI
ncbi:DNA binding domain-containing protein, excisionase family [Roseovarius tolerans]|uniref:DNA binding domain-containing protein, excisionase family n=1 Tax=Roseovarius tolerans TaxID=74031 RepID=A0A1H7WHD8_9RHOB|nr:helix-turn-helix domain-containing protein [Roseovarius tolerans]SEM21032.1 DNA binding domain-containing protein, excisionase family [Roseovarius tolerans]